MSAATASAPVLRAEDPKMSTFPAPSLTCSGCGHAFPTLRSKGDHDLSGYCGTGKICEGCHHTCQDERGLASHLRDSPKHRGETGNMYDVHAEKRGTTSQNVARRARLAARTGSAPATQRCALPSHPDSRSRLHGRREKAPHIVPDTGLAPVESPLPPQLPSRRVDAAAMGESASYRSHREHDASSSQSIYFTPPQSSAPTAQSEEENKSSDDWGSDVATVSRVERNSSDLPRRRKGKARALPRTSSEAVEGAPSSAPASCRPPPKEIQTSRPQQAPQLFKDTAKRPSRPRNEAKPPASSTTRPRASSTSPPPLVRADSPDLLEPSNRIPHPQLPHRPPRRNPNMEGTGTPSGRSFRATKDARAPAFCELCKLPFRNYSALQRHMADTKARHPFYCQDCMVEYEDFAALQHHYSHSAYCRGTVKGQQLRPLEFDTSSQDGRRRTPQHWQTPPKSADVPHTQPSLEAVDRAPYPAHRSSRELPDAESQIQQPLAEEANSKVPICPICFKSLAGDRNVSATLCGHIFCAECILQHLYTRDHCPTCRKRITPQMLIPLFF